MDSRGILIEDGHRVPQRDSTMPPLLNSFYIFVCIYRIHVLWACQMMLARAHVGMYESGCWVRDFSTLRTALIKVPLFIPALNDELAIW